MFSALAIRAVGRTAGVVVQEVRRQFADGQIMAGTKRPDYGPVIDICTAASLRELATPALLAVLTPAIIGFGIGFQALGAFLAAVILTGQLMANYLSNAGGAWDNAKKYIEDGNEGGKGSEAHKAAVIGDTVGDPFKDTAGPALNPLIKVMNLVSLLMLPAIISLRDNDGVATRIAGVALVVLIGAIAFSKREAPGIGADAVRRTAAGVAAPPVIDLGERRRLGRRSSRPGHGQAGGQEGSGQEGSRPRRPRPRRLRPRRPPANTANFHNLCSDRHLTSGATGRRFGRLTDRQRVRRTGDAVGRLSGADVNMHAYRRSAAQRPRERRG